MVYCDICGTEVDRHDEYCRVCCRKVSHPSTASRIRDTVKTRLASRWVRGSPTVEPEDEPPVPHDSAEDSRPVTGVLEDASTTNRKATPETTLDIPKPEQTLTENRAKRSRPDAKQPESPEGLDRLIPRIQQLEGAAKQDRALTQTLLKPVTAEVEKTEPAAAPEDLIAKIQELEKEKESLQSEVWKNRRRPSALAGYGLAGAGGLSLILSVVFTSTVLAFIGLGLLFWGALLLFIRPRQYVRSDLMDSTALSSLATVDRVVRSLGYNQKGIYLPVHNPEKAVAFIPSQPNSRLPTEEQVETQTFVKDPDGIAMVPPGLSLANLLEKELGGKFSEYTLQELAEKLPRLLIEDLEMVQDCQIKIDGDNVRFKFVESIYAEFCHRLRESTKVCSSLGCPLCSAMACVLAQVTGKPIEFDKDEYSTDGRTVESSYHVMSS